MVLLSHLQFLSTASTGFLGMKDGIALLKVWLNQSLCMKPEQSRGKGGGVWLFSLCC